MAMNQPVYGQEQTWDASSHASSRIVVITTHAWFEFVYELFKTTVTINGESHKLKWGIHSFDVVPGQYEVSISYPWIFAPECGKNSVTFVIRAGEVKSVNYKAGMIRYVPGKIVVE